MEKFDAVAAPFYWLTILVYHVYVLQKVVVKALQYDQLVYFYRAPRFNFECGLTEKWVYTGPLFTFSFLIDALVNEETSSE